MNPHFSHTHWKMDVLMPLWPVCQITPVAATLYNTNLIESIY